MDKETHRIKVIAENERLLMSNIKLRRDSDTLRAENERLREALESIANGDGIYGAQAWEYKRIALEALK